MPGFNLVRNAKVLYTNNVNASTGVVALSAHSAALTQEIQVMNGFSFSQNTETQNITVSEAGLDPARGQRTFNTALAPVDFSFTTYIRPKLNGSVTAEEKHLWNALLSDTIIDVTGLTVSTVAAFTRTASSNVVTFTCAAVNLTTAGIAVGDVVTVGTITDTTFAADWNAAVKITAITGTLTACTGMTIEYLNAPRGATTAPTSAPTTIKLFKGAVSQHPIAGSSTAAYLLAHSGRSNKNKLTTFGIIVAIDDVTYVIDNCSLGQASVEFGLDGIAQIAWTGQGTTMRILAATTLTTGTFGGAITGSYTPADTTAYFITNKLTTATLAKTLRGLGTTPTAYTIAITGGNLTINNNISYVTPEILGTVNQPIGYFTGTRAISGNVTAYLKSGAGKTGGLLSDMLTAATAPGGSENKYSLGLQVGGSSNATRVEFEMPGVMLQIPSIETADVVSTTINFTAEGFSSLSSAAAGVDAAAFDLEATNDLALKYFSAA